MFVERMSLVIIESPYTGNVERNLKYLRACMRDCLLRGESPFASHGLYTQEGVLDDDDEEERMLGIRAGFAWKTVADRTVVYTDFGVTDGMQMGIEAAQHQGHSVEYRTLPAGWERQML